MLYCTKRAFIPWENEDEYQPTKKFLTEQLAEKIYNLYLTDQVVKKPTETFEAPKSEKAITNIPITPPTPEVTNSNYQPFSLNRVAIVPRTLMPAE